MGGHQRAIEGRERRPRGRRRRRLALDPALPSGERAALVGKGGHGHDAGGDDRGDVGFMRLGRAVAREHGELAPEHEARGRHGRPSTSTLASMSAFSTIGALPPTAMMMTQVPVDSTVNGSLREAR